LRRAPNSDDCEDAALWLLERGSTELGVPAVFALGGESARASLAAVSPLRLRDRHGIRDAGTTGRSSRRT
jgi:acetyl esterase/lipase